MTLTRRGFTALAVSAALFATPVLAHDSGVEHDMHKLAIQVSDNDPGTATKVLNVVANAAKSFQEEGLPYEIEVVAYNAGLHLFRTDTSPALERVAGVGEGDPPRVHAEIGEAGRIKPVGEPGGGDPEQRALHGARQHQRQGVARGPVRLVHPGAGEIEGAEKPLAAIGPVRLAREKDVLHGGRIHVLAMFFTSHFRDRTRRQNG